MKQDVLLTAFESMRRDHLGKIFTRKELEILSPKYGFCINSQMWASGLGKLFIVSKIGNKFIYKFSSAPTRLNQVSRFINSYEMYLRDDMRRIIHAKRILGIE